MSLYYGGVGLDYISRTNLILICLISHYFITFVFFFFFISLESTFLCIHQKRAIIRTLFLYRVSEMSVLFYVNHVNRIFLEFPWDPSTSISSILSIKRISLILYFMYSSLNAGGGGYLLGTAPRSFKAPRNENVTTDWSIYSYVISLELRVTKIRLHEAFPRYGPNGWPYTRLLLLHAMFYHIQHSR